MTVHPRWDDRAVAEQRFVITGNSRLTIEVARRLDGLGATVVVLDMGDGALSQRLGIKGSPDESIKVVTPVEEDLCKGLAMTGLPGATCLLALADDDEENLLVALAGGEVAPDVPIVLQAFDEALADALEQAERKVQVRRAYSVGGLAAPFFVAHALGDENIRTMRFGAVSLPILRTEVGEGSPLVGKDAAQIRRLYDCEVIARSRGADAWEVMGEDAEPIAERDILVVGGPQVSVFTLACKNSPQFRRATRRRVWRSLRRRLTPRPRQWSIARMSQRRIQPTQLLFPAIPIILTLLLLASVTIIAAIQGLGLGEAVYVLVKTLLGEPGPDPRAALESTVAVVGLLVGWTLAGLLISFLAARFVTERLEETMAVRAERYANHAIVGGLGPVGYRVWELLHKLNVPCVVVDPAPEREFLEAVGQHDPVLAGTLRRAKVDDAVCLIATSENNIANVEGCMRAKSINPDIRTVARVFDDPLAERAGDAFDIDCVISAVEVAAAAFVDAARDPRAVRPFKLGERAFRGLRHEMVSTLSPEQIREQGLRILAFRRKGEIEVQPPSALDKPLSAGDAVVVVGPADAIDAFIADHAGDPQAA